MRNVQVFYFTGVFVKTFICICTCIIFCGCTLFQKNAGSNEMEELSEDVIKSKIGVDIQVKPIPKDSK